MIRPSVLLDILKTQSKRDFLVLNFGLHHNYRELFGDLQKETVAGIVGTYDAYARNHSDAPMLLWRETTPQHYATVDGTYYAGVHRELTGDLDTQGRVHLQVWWVPDQRDGAVLALELRQP